MYLTKILLSPITNLADARFAAAAGIDYICFCFDPGSANFITPIKAKEIIEWTSGSYTVAEFGDQPINEIVEITELLNMDVVLIKNNLLPDVLPQIGKPIIKVIDLNIVDSTEIEKVLQVYSAFADVFLVVGNINIVKHKKWLTEIFSANKIIWGLKIDATQIKECVETFKPYAIHLTPGAEEKTGMKDFDALYDVLDALEVGD